VRPFQRLPFAALPARPARPHPFFDLAPQDLVLDDSPFAGTPIRYRVTGDGPPLLLVHGLMTSGYSWRWVLAPLARHHRVWVPDLPGAGDSGKPDRRYDAPALAAAIGAFQRQAGIRGCACVGNSLGGYLCMRLALADPGAFSRLVNVHSPALPEPRLHALHAALAVPGVRAALAWWVRRDPLRWAHANVHYHDETLKSLEEARTYGAPLADPAGTRAFTAWLGEALAPRDLAAFCAALAALRARGAPFPVPLLLVYARQDPMVPPRIGHALHALVPGARLVWLEDSSHFAHVDSPERVVALVEEFFGAP